MISTPRTLKHHTRAARGTHTRVLAAIGVGLAMCAPALALQDAGSQPPPPPERQAGPDSPRLEISPERLRARLSSLLEEVEASSSRIASAIDLLDNDGSAEDAIDILGGPARVRRLAEYWGQWSRVSQPAGRTDRPGSARRPGDPADLGNDRGPDPMFEVSAEDVAAFLETHAPEFSARVQALEDKDPRRAEFLRNRLRPRVGEILATKQQDPELGDLLTREFRVGMELLDAGRRYARAVAANDPGLDEARAQLRALAGEQVDLRLARREHEIRTLARQIESLRSDVDEQRADRDRYIDEIVERAGAARGPEQGRPDPGDRRGARDGRPRRTDDR